MIRRPPRPPLFPTTPLSGPGGERHARERDPEARPRGMPLAAARQERRDGVPARRLRHDDQNWVEHEPGEQQREQGAGEAAAVASAHWRSSANVSTRVASTKTRSPTRAAPGAASTSKRSPRSPSTRYNAAAPA